MHKADLLRGLANNTLHLVLMPTEACNFRCTYCYEDFRCGRMQPAVRRGLKEFLARRAAGLHLLELSWFGGEPLLAMDVVSDISSHVRLLQQQYPQMHCTGEITTNGYLLSRTRFERLLDLGVTRFQISFDGPPAWHDRTRVRAGGHPTFDRIWARTVALRAVRRDFTVVARLHVDRDNHAALPEFIHQYAAAFAGDARFRLFIRRIARLGGPHAASLPIFDAEQGGVVCRSLGRLAESLGILNVTVDPHAPVCYAARGNSYVVRADGRLNKCTVALEHPNNQVGRIDADGLLQIDNSKMNQWMRGLWSGDADVLACPMRGYADPGPFEPGTGRPPEGGTSRQAWAPVALVLPQTPA